MPGIRDGEDRVTTIAAVVPVSIPWWVLPLLVLAGVIVGVLFLVVFGRGKPGR